MTALRYRARPASRAAARPAGRHVSGGTGSMDGRGASPGLRALAMVDRPAGRLRRRRNRCGARGGIDRADARASTNLALRRPGDVGWMLALTSERVRARIRPYDSRNGVDAEIDPDEQACDRGGHPEIGTSDAGPHRRHPQAPRHPRRLRLDRRTPPDACRVERHHLQRHCAGRAADLRACSRSARRKLRSGLETRLSPNWRRATFRVIRPATPQDFRWWSGLARPTPRKRSR